MSRRRRQTIDRNPLSRVELWDRKLEPETYRTYLTAVKPLALRKFSEYQCIHESLIKEVKEILAKFPEETSKQHAYMWFTQGIWYCTQRYEDKALLNEVGALIWYWYLLGLKWNVLKKLTFALGVDFDQAIKVTIDKILVILKELGVPIGMAFFKTRRYQGTVKKVNWLEPRLIDEVLPSEYCTSLLPDRIRIRYVNPAGSKTTLIVIGKLVYKFGGEVDCIREEISEGKDIEYVYMREFISRAYRDNDIPIGFRLYAYVSTTPVSGYEPQVVLTDFSGIQV